MGCIVLMDSADHGADIVKVERPDGGDPLRHSPPFQQSESAPFILGFRNKRSIVLDLMIIRFGHC